jgi:hypothetical protein
METSGHPKKPKKGKRVGAEARWEKSGEGEFEGIIHLGNNRDNQSKKTESRWAQNHDEGAVNQHTRRKKTEAGWEEEKNP